jgi:hypothetical protein
LARHVRPSAFPLLVKAGITARAVSPGAIVALVLTLAWLSLLLTAPADGDFWWSDAPRHALNGAFVKDFVAAHPIDDPVQWAINYYLMRPALTLMFYPPLFYGVEAIAFALFGVSHFVAQFAVSLFVLLLAVSAYTLSRMCLPRWSALGAALLAIGSPEAALWGRQVMLDLPAYALIVASACCLTRYLRDGRPLSIYLTALFLLAAIYTKYNAGFVAPALIAVLLIAKGRRVLGDRHAIVAGALTVFGLLPAIFILFKFGAVNGDSVSGLEGTLPLNSLACWLFYIKALPGQLGTLTVALGAGGLALIVGQIAKRRDHGIHPLLLLWLAVGYLFFTLIGLKETRNTVMVLLPLTIAAPLFLLEILPKSFGEAAGLALGVGTLGYTLILCPVPRVEGYQDIALYLAKNVPYDGVVLYSGYRDANLIFDLGTHRDRSDISIVRVDKLLLSAPVGERRRGIKQADYDVATIARMLRELGATYFVVQPGFWSDLSVMARFEIAINGSDYKKTAHFSLTGDLSSQDGTQGIDILRPTYAMAGQSKHISIDMPLAGQRFEGTIQP